MDKDTRAIVEQVAEEAATRAVHDTMTLFGMDPDDPIRSQRNMAALEDVRKLIEDPTFRDNLLWVTEIREAISISKKKGLTTAVGLLVTMLVGLVVYGARTRIETWFGG